MNWEILIALQILTASFARILQKKVTAQPKADPIAFSMIYQILNGVLIGVFAVATGHIFLDYENLFPNIIYATILYTFAGVFFYKSLKLADASTVSLILATTSVWTTLSSIYFLNERLNSKEIIGITFILSSILLISYKGFSTLKFNRGEVYALIASIFFGVALTNDFYIIGEDDPYLYSSLSFILPGLLTMLVFPKHVNKISWFLSKRVILKLFVVCGLYSTALVSMLLAYNNGGKGSILSPLSQMSVILIVFLSIFLLNERKDLKIKLIASVVSVIGVMITVIN